MTDRQHFAYQLIPPRDDFFASQTDDERVIMARHVEYWSAKLAAGQVVAFGPVLTPGGAWGLAVLEVENLEQAERLRDGDPAVASGLATVAIHPMPRAVVRPG